MVNSFRFLGQTLTPQAGALGLPCPDGHTSCCIYVLLKALLRLLSYEESKCTETGVEAN